MMAIAGINYIGGKEIEEIARRQKMEEALRWYAEQAEALARRDHKDCDPRNEISFKCYDLVVDAGKRAREALGEGEEG